MKNNIIHFIAVLFLTASIALITTGCQTKKGFGKDMEKLGEKIQGD